MVLLEIIEKCDWIFNLMWLRRSVTPFVILENSFFEYFVSIHYSQLKYFLWSNIHIVYILSLSFNFPSITVRFSAFVSSYLEQSFSVLIDMKFSASICLIDRQLHLWILKKKELLSEWAGWLYSSARNLPLMNLWV